MKKYFPVLEYINIPNLITTLGLVWGVFACYHLIGGNLRAAIICMFFATFMDLIDGYLANVLDRKTRFGHYMDSLVDFFICCILPMLMAYVFVGNDPILVFAFVFYCAGGLWRLAYYNITSAEKQSYFTGLPVPGAMLCVVMVIWSAVNYDIPAWACTAVFFITGLLMISFIRMKKYGTCQKILWLIWMGFFAVLMMS